jgi:hypothetical protein
MAKKKTASRDVEAGEVVESDHRPATFVPDPSDPTKMRQSGPQAVDLSEYEGEWYKQDEPPDSEPYMRKLVPDDPYGQTVHMKNQDRTWSGTPDQAKAQFSKTPPEESAGDEPPAV